jgi:hypothetical protein
VKTPVQTFFSIQAFIFGRVRAVKVLDTTGNADAAQKADA